MTKKKRRCLGKHAHVQQNLKEHGGSGAGIIGPADKSPDDASEVDTPPAHCDLCTPAVATMPPRILPVVSPSPREHESAVSPSSLFVTMRGPRRLGGRSPN